jgi:hypothetical protein
MKTALSSNWPGQAIQQAEDPARLLRIEAAWLRYNAWHPGAALEVLGLTG